MKKLQIVIFITYTLLIGWAPSALSVDVKARPVEYRMCHFRDGKSYDDLEKVTAKFREYANQNDTGYAAWLLRPDIRSSQLDMDLGWLGAWPDGEDYGVSMERWKSPSNDLMRQFGDIIECPNHFMLASLPINAPEGTPEDGILLSYACSLNEGKTIDDAYKAHLDYGQTMKANGSLSVSWFYRPLAGFGDNPIDYYHIVGFYRYSDLGATMELFLNDGGMKTREKIIDPIATCHTPNVYDAISVRAHDER